MLRLEIIGQPMMNMSFRNSDKRIIKQFENDALRPEIKYHTFRNHTLRYLKLTHNPRLPYVVFIHGAPGSLSDYTAYFKDKKLYSKVNIISVDRLGYGNSEFGNSQTSLKVQAEAIQSLLAEVGKNNNYLIVGHSYGGPIAVHMAMDFPAAYIGLIMLAPALDPENEKEIKIASLAMNQPIRWLTPAALRVAADEKHTHVEELKKMMGKYDQIRIPVCHIHGTSDSLVPYKNVAFSEHNIAPEFLEIISLEKVDHFLPWSHHDLIVNTIIDYAAREDH
jgi:pimeloyl-ACP methyl ester carboxylesterase